MAAAVTTTDILEATPSKGSNLTKDEIIERVKGDTDAGVNRVRTEFTKCCDKGWLELTEVKRRGTQPKRLYCLSDAGELEMRKRNGQPKEPELFVPVMSLSKEMDFGPNEEISI
jgi:DNA-binding PadR family transcriptional regulator